ETATAPTPSGFRVLSSRDHAAPMEKPITPILRPDTDGTDRRYSWAPMTIFLILSSSIFDWSSFASSTVVASAPSWRSGASARYVWGSIRLLMLLYKDVTLQ